MSAFTRDAVIVYYVGLAQECLVYIPTHHMSAALTRDVVISYSVGLAKEYLVYILTHHVCTYT